MKNRYKKHLILIELNEINFDIVKAYINHGEHLPAFSKLLNEGIIETSAEKEYELLEPWVQWVSVHTGKEFPEHKVFRLGDISNFKGKQIFEILESRGFKVGAISPMNAKNNLNKPAYFIPDPWTNTKSDETFLSRNLTKAISQAVNDNASARIKPVNLLRLIFAFVFLVNPKNYVRLSLFALSCIKKPWRKALLFDLFLSEIHSTLYKSKKPNFSTLFLNAGAHIQHHYLFNSKMIADDRKVNPDWYINKCHDPILDMLQIYDFIINGLMKIQNSELIIATGLSQKPYEATKFYYRLNDHESFLNLLNIKFSKVYPRMTRDFLIEFEDIETARDATTKLKKLSVNNNLPLFGIIDNRGKDIFVTLTYPLEIKDTDYVILDDRLLHLKKELTFVAIKNGMHQSKGWAYFSNGLTSHEPPNESHVSSLFFVIKDFFQVSRES